MISVKSTKSLKYVTYEMDRDVELFCPELANTIGVLISSSDHKANFPSK